MKTDEAKVVIPRSLKELERRFHRADEDTRQAMMGAMRADDQWLQRGYMELPKPRASGALKLFEDRVLACIRKPIRDVRFDRADLVPSQRYGWRDMVQMRSGRFIRLLRALYRSTPWLRPEIMEHLAWTGMDEVLAFVVGVLRKGPADQISGVARGLQFAGIHKRGSPAYGRRAFAALAPLVTGARDLGTSDKARNAHFEAVAALEEIDHPRAMALLKSDACLRPDNRALLSVLFRLQSIREDSEAKFGRAIDPALLWPAFDAAKRGRARTFPDRSEGLMGLILAFTADLDPARTKPEAQAMIRAAKGEVWTQGSEFAKEALKRCKRIPEPRSCLTRLHRSARNFGPAATKVLRAYELAEHVLTDGLVLYYCNCGGQLKDAEAGLRLMKLGRAAELLGQGAGVLVPQNEACTPAGLRRAYDTMTAAQEAKLKSIERAFERVNDSILGGVERYIAGHAGEFRARR